MRDEGEREEGRQAEKMIRFPALITQRRMLPLTVIRTAGEGAGLREKINLVQNAWRLR